MDGYLETPPASNNPLTGYLQTLRSCKTSLPHGQLVCVSASPNITSTSSLLRLAATVGPHIAVLQVHADIIDDWSAKTVRRLTYLAKVYGFLIWEGGRILNSQIGARGGVEYLSDEKNKRDVEMAKKRYTKGVVNVASWAGLATSWMIPDESDGQRNESLIPTLRQAARETVAMITRSVRTEITAGEDSHSAEANDRDEEDDDDDDDNGEEAVDAHESNNGFSDGLRPALPMRKESFIALTRTITQRSESSLSSRPSTAENGHDHPDNGMGFEMIARPLRPPVLVRGLIINLVPNYGSEYTIRYRKSCLDAARSNQDFVVGFVTDDSWLDPAKSENLLDPEIDDVGGDDDTESDESRESASPFIFFSPLEIEHFGEVSQSVPSARPASNRGLRSVGDNDEDTGTGAETPTQSTHRETARNSDRGIDIPSLSARAISQAALLNRLVGRALEVRENNIALDSRRRRRKRNPDILSIPVITMTA
ncbi:hypothetical protein FQN54_001231 [Arachnomyces sp. PD_36]|nr:hypothetical protein FQN54_001231 [Arachnomyces sp. PD_36]